MTHEYNTRSSKVVNAVAIIQEDLTRLQQNIIDSLKDEISNGDSSLKDEMNNLKDAVIKRLQEENLNLPQKCNKLEAKIANSKQSRILWLNMKGEITLLFVEYLTPLMITI